MPIAVSTAMVIGAAISAAVTAASTAFNAYETGKTNEQNKDLYEDSLAANKEVAQNGLTWKVQDAKRAGLSPLAALNSSTHGNLVSATTPTMQAPQADLSALLASLSSMSNEYASDETKKEIAEIESETDLEGHRQDNETRLKIARLTAENNLDMCKRNIASSEKVAQGQLDEKARENDNALNLDFLKFSRSYSLQLEQSEYEQTIKGQERQLESYYSTAKNLSNMCQLLDVPFEIREYPVKDEKDVDSMNMLNDATFRRVTDAYETYDGWRNSPDRTNEDFSIAFSHSTSKNSTRWKQQSVDASGNVGVSGITGNTGNLLGNFPAVGGGIGATNGEGSGEGSAITNSYTKDKSNSQMKLSELFRSVNGRNKTMVYYVPRYENTFYHKLAAGDWSGRSYKSGSIYGK